MQSQIVAYHADVALSGTLYLPDGSSPRPAVVVFPDIVGLGDHAHERAARLAKECGYVALAADLHGDAKRISLDLAMEQLDRFYADPSITCGRGDAALKLLADHPAVDGQRIATIGFCYGGTLGLELARRGADLAAVVGFHSNLSTKNPDGAKRIKGRILACIGSEDPSIPVEQRVAFEEEMRGASVDWQLHVYGGVYHTFTDRRCDDFGMPDFARYDAQADRRSWLSMCAVLNDALG